MIIFQETIAFFILGAAMMLAAAQATPKQPSPQPGKGQQKSAPAKPQPKAPAASVPTSLPRAQFPSPIQNSEPIVSVTPQAQQSQLPPIQRRPALPQKTISQAPPQTFLRAPTKDELIWQRTQQIYAERLKNDPRVLTLETGPGTTRDTFLPWLKKYHWDEAMKQAQAEVNSGVSNPH